MVNRRIVHLFFCLLIKLDTVAYEFIAKLFDDELGLFCCNFSLCFRDFVELFLLLSSQVQNMSLGDDLTVFLCGDLLHKANNSIEHGSAFIKGGLFLLRADENKLGVFLASATLHLNECLHSKQLI